VYKMIILTWASFERVVLGHKSVSKKYDTLSTLVGAEALDIQNQEDCMPVLKPWVTGVLATMFSNLDSLTHEDGDVIARIATSDTSGSLMKDRYVSPGHVCRVPRLITGLQYHTEHRMANARRGSREDNLHDGIPYQDVRVAETTH
jgi:hypothetical protein